MKTLPVVLALLLTLGACSYDAAKMSIIASVEKARELNDDEARLVKASTCVVRLGAFLRIYNKAEQDAMAVLCYGEIRNTNNKAPVQ